MCSAGPDTLYSRQSATSSTSTCVQGKARSIANEARGGRGLAERPAIMYPLHEMQRDGSAALAALTCTPHRRPAKPGVESRWSVRRPGVAMSMSQRDEFRPERSRLMLVPPITICKNNNKAAQNHQAQPLVCVLCVQTVEVCQSADWGPTTPLYCATWEVSAHKKYMNPMLTDAVGHTCTPSVLPCGVSSLTASALICAVSSRVGASTSARMAPPTGCADTATDTKVRGTLSHGHQHDDTMRYTSCVCCCCWLGP